VRHGDRIYRLICLPVQRQAHLFSDWLKLGYLDVICLPTLRSFYNIELDRLALFERTESLALDGRVVNEYVLAVGAADEPEALGVVKPFHCSVFHDRSSVTCCVAELRMESFASKAEKQNRQKRQVGFDDQP
jgi:hypothetical protein